MEGEDEVTDRVVLDKEEARQDEGRRRRRRTDHGIESKKRRIEDAVPLMRKSPYEALGLLPAPLVWNPEAASGLGLVGLKEQGGGRGWGLEKAKRQGLVTAHKG